MSASLMGAPLAIIIVCLAALVSFIVIFLSLACGLRNEVVIARRCLVWVRLTLAVMFVAHGLQLHYELALAGSKVTIPGVAGIGRVVLPSLGFVKPIAGLVLTFIAFFVSSHPLFRWITVVTIPVFIASDLFAAAALRAEIDCRLSGLCMKQAGLATDALEVLEVRQYVAAFCGLWTLLITSYLMFVMGIFQIRYPVRLFSLTRPLAQLKHATAASTPLKDDSATDKPKAHRRKRQVHPEPD